MGILHNIKKFKRHKVEDIQQDTYFVACCIISKGKWPASTHIRPWRTTSLETITETRRCRRLPLPTAFLEQQIGVFPSEREIQSCIVGIQFIIREAPTLPHVIKVWGSSLIVTAECPGKSLSSSPTLLLCPSFVGRGGRGLILPLIKSDVVMSRGRDVGWGVVSVLWLQLLRNLWPEPHLLKGLERAGKATGYRGKILVPCFSHSLIPGWQSRLLGKSRLPNKSLELFFISGKHWLSSFLSFWCCEGLSICQQREATGSALPIPTVTVPSVTTKEAVIIYSFSYVYLYPDLVHEKCVVPQGSFCDKSWLSSVFVFKWKG